MSIKTVVKGAFRVLGYEVNKVYRPAESQSWFKFHETCQIPYLSSIYLRIFGKEHIGLVVEVGAFDGEKFSNSSGLIERGWSGLLIEPIPTYADLCREKYKENTNVRVVQSAASNVNGSTSILISGPLSTINSDLADEYTRLDWAKNEVGSEIIEVQTRTLDSILESNNISSGFEVLVVDVEGFETEVFEGFNIEFWKPKMIIVELTDFHPTLELGKDAHFYLGKEISAHGYVVIFKDSINTIFVQENLLTKVFSK